MNDPILGKIIKGDARRDAIHIAITPVTSDYTLQPGQHVGLDGSETKVIGIVADPIGIVDPFLKGPVAPGSRFWLFLYPKTITSLRHDWSHPAFKRKAMSSREWIENLAGVFNLSYQELMDGAAKFLDNGDCLEDDFQEFTVPGSFWKHYENVTSTIVPHEKRENFFTCCA